MFRWHQSNCQDLSQICHLGFHHMIMEAKCTCHPNSDSSSSPEVDSHVPTEHSWLSPCKYTWENWTVIQTTRIDNCIGLLPMSVAMSPMCYASWMTATVSQLHMTKYFQGTTSKSSNYEKGHVRHLTTIIRPQWAKWRDYKKRSPCMQFSHAIFTC